MSRPTAGPGFLGFRARIGVIDATNVIGATDASAVGNDNATYQQWHRWTVPFGEPTTDTEHLRCQDPNRGWRGIVPGGSPSSTTIGATDANICATDATDPQP